MLADGLVFIIDNADVIIAGLKGIGAALVLTKAVDGAGKLKNKINEMTTASKNGESALGKLSSSFKSGLVLAGLSGLRYLQSLIL